MVTKKKGVMDHLTFRYYVNIRENWQSRDFEREARYTSGWIGEGAGGPLVIRLNQAHKRRYMHYATFTPSLLMT